jgi:hypothetical protein
MSCKGRVLHTQGNPVPICTIETREKRDKGMCVPLSSFQHRTLARCIFDTGLTRSIKAGQSPTAAADSSPVGIGTTACVGRVWLRLICDG